ncbi:MAG: hypothetical protein WCJ72_15665, partial [Chryseobacterium sp.]
ALISCLINIFSQPLLYSSLLNLTYNDGKMLQTMIAGEILVIMIESFLYLMLLTGIRKNKSTVFQIVILSCIANALSAIAGIVFPIP